ncbi:hypothetical protein [Methyloraptor flagellatus]|uniref:Peptidase M41 domain-containing protein n=1 Tax=Methyloraptor flagellatus TaxID=3162530 RepID=A0AAU7X8L1_9HYPH
MDWVRQARRTARAAGRPMILEDLESAAIPNFFRDTASARRAAIHEAGHAVAGIVTGARVESVSLGSAGTAGGRTRLRYDDVHFQLRDDLVGRILTLLAGRAAEQVVIGSVSTGAGGSDESDLAHATREMESMWARFGFGADLLYQPAVRATGLLEDPVVRREIADELSAHYRRALELVAEHRDAIERIADALIARRFLTGDEVSRLM